MEICQSRLGYIQKNDGTADFKEVDDINQLNDNIVVVIQKAAEASVPQTKPSSQKFRQHNEDIEQQTTHQSRR